MVYDETSVTKLASQTMQYTEKCPELCCCWRSGFIVWWWFDVCKV